MDPMSDESIVSTCLTGDAAGFEAIHAAHARRVMAYLRRSGFRQHDAEDLCQETFVRVFRHLHSFDASRGSLGGWISAIAHNVVRKHWRRSGAATGQFDPELAEQTLGVHNPTDTAEKAETNEAVDDCVSQLPAELERLVHLRYVEARTTRGIAEVMGIPEATVRLRLGKAQDLIRRCLEGKGIRE